MSITKFRTILLLSIFTLSIVMFESCAGKSMSQSRKCAKKSASSKKVHKMAPTMAR